MDLKLTELEQIALEGLKRQQDQLDLAAKQLNQKAGRVFAAVEGRLGLEAGSIGKTHSINLDTGEVELAATPAANPQGN